MKCIIVDDDPSAIKLIAHFVQQTDFLELAASFESAIEAANFIRNNEVDLIFLDVEMPEMTGLDFLGTLNDPPQVILNTSNSDYALQAFDYEATDFLLKPAKYPRFLRAANKARENLEQIAQGNGDVIERELESLFVKEENVMRKILIEDILWIEALGDYINIHLRNEKKTILSTMKNVERKLPADRFIRVHRSFIVNVDRIDIFDSSFVVINEKLIPIGNSYKKNLSQKLNLL